MMDHQHQHLHHQSGSTISPMDNKDHEEFLDEPQPLQVKLQHVDDDSCRPLQLDTPEAGEGGSFENGSPEARSDNPSPDADPSLPLILRLLFGLNGLSLSLLTLPIMYILNTRVAVPLSYLPAYGAIAFLPYSLKPMYAYLCGLWAKKTSKVSPRSNTNNNTIESIPNQHNNHHNHHNSHRYLSLFRWLLACTSLCTLLFASIPKGGVLAVFIVSFVRGFSDSWAEFCLGLTLIDHARANYLQNYEIAVSGLQAQAATAGNLGSWLASLITCLILVGRYFASESESGDNQHQPQLTGGLTNGLVIATALVQLGGAAFVYFWEKGQLISSRSHGDGIYDELSTGAWQEIRGNATRGSFEPGVISTESDSLRDEVSSQPSYSSLEDIATVEDDGDSTSLYVEGASSFQASNRSRSPTRIANWAMVILLQCVLMIIALKGPIIEVSSHFLWAVLVTTLTMGICVAAIALYCKLGDDSNMEGSYDTTTYRVGLFLILKNAIPSDSAILASFFYSLFGVSQPLLMQFLSFLGMGVSSLSSWSYTRLFSKRFGSGRPLVGLMAGTTTLASLASLLHIVVFRAYQHSEVEESEGDDGRSSLPSRNLLLIAIVSKFLTTFFDEWAFLPELLLATTSVKVPTLAEPTSTTSPSPADTIDNCEAGSSSESAIVSRTPPEDDNDSDHHVNTGVEDDQQQRIAMEYGTLVSCIDFGDQLGSLLAAPLVAVWQISRENGFLHLDRLIVFCSLANVAITIGLLPLLWNSGPNTKR